MAVFHAAELPGRRAYALLVGSVVPRPIAWASTLDAEGRANLAPFSFFNAVGARPPTVVLSCGRHADGLRKDTAANVLATGEVAISVASRDLLDRLVATSGDHAPGVSEWEVAGVTPAPCVHVAPPRVAEAPVALECRLLQHLALGAEPDDDTLMVLEVLAFHVRDDVLVDGRIDPALLDPIARLGGTGYASLGEVVHRERPSIGRADG